MKTTLVIDDGVYSRLKQEAARHGVTISELVEAALRQILNPKKPLRPLPPLPTYDMGEPLVDVANREALDELFDKDKDLY
jgi:hypothetical protein